MHSKLKLAVAMLTSPTAAFEEILKRRLLGSALVIVAVTGALSCVPPILSSVSQGPVQLALLGKDNPLVWMGVFFLYSAAFWKLLKWIGTEVDYPDVLTIMGWAQVTLLVSQLSLIVGGIAGLSSLPNASVLSFTTALSIVLLIWYVGVIGLGIKAVSLAPLSRGITAYLVVQFSAVIALGSAYGIARTGPFKNALAGIKTAANAVITADQTPWIAASVVGLVLGLWLLGRSLDWDPGRRNRAMAGAGLVGAAVLAIYIAALKDAGYYSDLLRAQRLYNRGHYSAAAGEMQGLLALSPGNVELALDMGRTYFLAGDTEASLSSYEKSIALTENAQGLNEKLADAFLAQAHSGMGTVYDFAGKYDLAIQQFKKAEKEWPEFREPWVRMAVTYDRMGRYDKAIDSANHAVKKLDSDATVAWVALAQAFAQTGDIKQAQTAITMVNDRDEDLAKRIGEKPEDWKDAVSELTREDLEFPLEEQLAPPQSKEEPKKRETSKEEESSKKGK